MGRYLLILLVSITLCASASAASRELLQSCPIYKCATNRCLLEDAGGVRRWTCSACQATYRLLDKRACVCPPGFYESGGRCTQCDVAFHCRGGNGNGASAADGSVGNSMTTVNTSADGVAGGLRSYKVACGSSMTTALRGSRTEASCVTNPGYSYTNVNTATACPVNTYNPGNNRIATCFRCPSGLATSADTSDSKNDCLVPAGWTMTRGVPTPCARGTYREGAVPPTSPNACVRCPRGWTTGNVGTTLKTECNLLLPGFKSSGTQNGVAAAEECARGSYYVGGTIVTTCTSCNGYTTVAPITDTDGGLVGAKSASECVAPPGYYLNTNVLTECGDGEYQDGWGRRTSCKLCGDGIASAPNTENEHPDPTRRDSDGTVRGAATDCYIEPGFGMVFDRATSRYREVSCPVNTYGVNTREYGLKFTPCKPCPRGLVSGALSTHEDNCTNTAGWGFNGFTAEICGPGFYVAAGTRVPCTQCPPYRNTTSIGAEPFFTDAASALPLPGGSGTDQNGPEDCKVIPGYGLMTAPVGGENTLELSQLDTIECPVGTWSAGGSLTSSCTTCSGFRTTNSTGSVTDSDCNLCLAGYGKTNSAAGSNATVCTGCLLGFFQDGATDACSTCGTSSFLYPGKEEVSAVPSTTRPGTATVAGAKARDQCYPQYYQLDESMGTYLVPKANMTVDSAPTSAKACAEACEALTDCAFSTWEYANTLAGQSANTSGVCHTFVPIGSDILAFKALPTDTVTAASNGRAAVASGSYVVYDGDTAAMIGGDISGPTTQTVTACKNDCDNTAACVAVYYAGGSCTLRSGLEAEGMRTFVNIVGAQVDFDGSADWP